MICLFCYPFTGQQTNKLVVTLSDSKPRISSKLEENNLYG